MAAVTFDTLKVRRLTEAGLDARTAEGVSETLAEVMTNREDALATRADIEALHAATAADIERLRVATTTDIESLRVGTKADIVLLRNDLDGLRGELRHDVDLLRAEMSAQGDKLRGEMRALHSDTLRWVIGSIFAAMAVLFAAIKLV